MFNTLNVKRFFISKHYPNELNKALIEQPDKAPPKPHLTLKNQVSKENPPKNQKGECVSKTWTCLENFLRGFYLFP